MVLDTDGSRFDLGHRASIVPVPGLSPWSDVEDKPGARWSRARGAAPETKASAGTWSETFKQLPAARALASLAGDFPTLRPARRVVRSKRDASAGTSASSGPERGAVRGLGSRKIAARVRGLRDA
jgi:hypothetical protein